MKLEKKDVVVQAIPPPKYVLTLTQEEAYVMRGLIYTFCGNTQGEVYLKAAVETPCSRGLSPWDGPHTVEPYAKLFKSLWTAFSPFVSYRRP
jgi:hypothetical protein